MIVERAAWEQERLENNGLCRSSVVRDEWGHRGLLPVFSTSRPTRYEESEGSRPNSLLLTTVLERSARSAGLSMSEKVVIRHSCSRGFFFFQQYLNSAGCKCCTTYFSSLLMPLDSVPREILVYRLICYYQMDDSTLHTYCQSSGECDKTYMHPVLLVEISVLWSRVWALIPSKSSNKKKGVVLLEITIFTKRHYPGCLLFFLLVVDNHFSNSNLRSEAGSVNVMNSSVLALYFIAQHGQQSNPLIKHYSWRWYVYVDTALLSSAGTCFLLPHLVILIVSPTYLNTKNCFELIDRICSELQRAATYVGVRHPRYKSDAVVRRDITLMAIAQVDICDVEEAGCDDEHAAERFSGNLCCKSHSAMMRWVPNSSTYYVAKQEKSEGGKPHARRNGRVLIYLWIYMCVCVYILELHTYTSSFVRDHGFWLCKGRVHFRLYYSNYSSALGAMMMLR